MHTYQHSYQPTFDLATKKQSVISRFLEWCEAQESSRFGWLGVTLASHGCFLAPFTLFLVFAAGNNFAFWGMTMGAMAMSLVVNLAALPTKITIPVFFLSVLIDLSVMVMCLAVII